MRKPKPSRYEQLRNQTVTQINPERSARTGGVRDGTAEDGRPFLQVTFGPGEVYDASFLLQQPQLARPFAEALYAWGRLPNVKSRRTRHEGIADLRRGWSTFAAETKLSGLSLEELDAHHVNGFIAWLNQTSPDGIARWAEGTRAVRLGALGNTVHELRRLYPNRVRSSLYIRDNPWPGRHRRSHPTEVVSHETWRKLFEAACAEVAESIARFEEGQRLISEGSLRLPPNPTSRADYKELSVCLAALDSTYPGVIPDFEAMKRTSPHIAWAVQEIHKWSKIAPYFYPSARALVPFVILLAIAALFNSDPLLGLAQKDIRREFLFGKERIVISVYKNRARRMQTRSFPVDEDVANPDTLLGFLKRWTARIRPFASPAHRHRVFIYVPLWGQERGVTGFENKSGGNATGVWAAHLRSFLKKHGLDHLTLQNIRATGLDIIHELFVGDLRAVSAAGGQRNPDTIERHYTSDAARKRNEERLAPVMATRERWVRTRGRVDPRGQVAQADALAATPGAACADPYASPQLGQKPGRLCSAYGACWDCPLFLLRPKDPYQLARALQFKAEIHRAREYLPPLRWLTAWAPLLAALNQRLLPQFSSPNVIAEAEQRFLSLPPLPQLD